MLTIGKLGGSDGAARNPSYYTSVVASGREDYYAGRGEAPGNWVGQGSAQLGLSGEVGEDDLAALMGGRRPGSSEQLRRPFGERAVVGFDLTFSAPKSVSVLYGLGDEGVSEAVRVAHDGAVGAALEYLEREACRARRGKGGLEQVPGEGFVAGAFRHRTSRAGDPQLHTHAVVCNLTRAPDGRYTALDGRALYHQAKTGGYLYQSELRARLSDALGLEWGAVEKGVAELRGIPRSVLEHFSVRRAEILERAAEQGRRSRRARQVAAYETRRAKDYGVPLDRLRDQWRARATEHGLSDQSASSLRLSAAAEFARSPPRRPWSSSPGSLRARRG